MEKSLLGGIFLVIQLFIVQAIATTPDFSLVGFAASVTGGTGGTVVTPTTASQFEDYCSSSEKLIIKLTCEIDSAEADIASNKTILGIGTSGILKGSTLNMTDGSSNIIVRNITIHHAPKGGDIFHIEGASNIWIDHCEIYNSIGDLNGDGIVDTTGDISGGDVDWYDGLIDATKASSNITVSWNKIHDSFKCMLVGKSDSDTIDRKMTIHHNYFYKIWERIPSYRGGTGHVYNNYYLDIEHSGVNSRKSAKLRVEGNVFENTGSGAKDSKTTFTWGPIGAYYSTNVGFWDVADNIFTNCKGNQPTTSTCTFTPSYTYSNTLHASSEVKAVVTAYAGVGIIDGTDINPVDNSGINSKISLINNHSNTFYFNCRGEKISNQKTGNGQAAGILISKNYSGTKIILNKIN